MSTRLTAALAAMTISASAWLSAQPGQTFQFVVSATDAAGAPVTSLQREDVVMSENGAQQEVVRVDPLAVPLKITIAVDNGVDSEDAIGHYRAGLTAMVEALPPDVEVTLIATAPQPRTVVRPTSDRAQILRGINAFSPEQARPRFTDALVEYSERLQREAKDRKMVPYVPVMLMLSTAAIETSSYQPKEIEKAVNFLVARHARLNVVMMSTRVGDATTAAGMNTSLQAIVSMPVVKATNGRYEALAVASRLRTLLPEWGRDLAALHARQINQHRVTVERSRGGELQNPRIELARPGLSGSVTLDGYLP
jgi:hypothetical protein